MVNLSFLVRWPPRFRPEARRLLYGEPYIAFGLFFVWTACFPRSLLVCSVISCH